jgi:hypothetical protein
MAPATGTALLILAVFVLPGFITLLMRERAYAVKGEETPFERLLNALFYSAIIYALVLTVGWAAGLSTGDLSAFYSGDKPLGADIGAALLVGAALPLAIVGLGARWRRSGVRTGVLERVGVSPAHGVQSAWNDWFARGDTAFLRVTLTDGRVVGGFYGEGSFAAYSEHSQDLFLSQRWELDGEGWFQAPASGTAGLWLSRESVVSIELYEPPRDQPDVSSAAPLVTVNIC